MFKIAVLMILALMLTAGIGEITVFVIPPIGAIPEGKTLIIYRQKNTNFIDSPDSMCERIQGGVSLLCRGMAIMAITNNNKILAKFPYSNWLYQISTDGKSYVN